MKAKRLLGIFPLQRAAVRYARKGIAILPLRPGQKLPVLKGSLLRATHDEEMIRFYWDLGREYDVHSILHKINAPILLEQAKYPEDHSRYEYYRERILSEEDLQRYRDPHYNIGVLTGERNGITVLDKDVKEKDLGDGLIGSGKKAWKLLRQQYGEKPFATLLQVRTPSGGSHYYYLYQNGIPNRAPLFQDDSLYGIDCRNDGGFVVAPPSKIEEVGEGGHVLTKKYRWRKVRTNDTSVTVSPRIDFSTLPEFPGAVSVQLDSERAERECWKKECSEAQGKVMQDDQDAYEDEDGEYAPQSLADCIKYLDTFDVIAQGDRNKATRRTCYYILGKFRLLSYEDQLEALEYWNETRCDPPQKPYEIAPVLQWSLDCRDWDESEGHHWIKPRTVRKSDDHLSPIERLKNRFGEKVNCINIVAANRFVREEYPGLRDRERANLLMEMCHG